MVPNHQFTYWREAVKIVLQMDDNFKVTYKFEALNFWCNGPKSVVLFDIVSKHLFDLNYENLF